MDQIQLKVNSLQDMDGEKSSKCRTCNASGNNANFCFLFKQWKTPWSSKQTTIANDLMNITGLHLKENDRFSKLICNDCCNKLREACIFVKLVQDTNAAMIMSESTAWPKPILVDKSIPNTVDIEIKQEVLSDDDNDRGESWIDTNVGMTEIKIEPEEMICSKSLNGLLDVKRENEYLTNGNCFPIEALSAMVKEEVSEDECDSDLPLNCVLCSKSFSCITGLKAHVIAQHSYNIKKNKSLSLHVCVVCKRTFETSTALMVHETCHDKNKCYDCNQQFDSFVKLSKHSRLCSARKHRKASPPKVLTLEEVRRNPPSEGHIDTPKLEPEPEPFKCSICGSTFTDEYYFRVHKEIHDAGDPTNTPTLSNTQTETIVGTT